MSEFEQKSNKQLSIFDLIKLKGGLDMDTFDAQKVVIKLIKAGLKCPDELKEEIRTELRKHDGCSWCIFGATDPYSGYVVAGESCPAKYMKSSCLEVEYAYKLIRGSYIPAYENRTRYQVFNDLVQVMLKDDLDKDLNKILTEKLDTIIKNVEAYDNLVEDIKDGKFINGMDKNGNPIVKTEE